MCRVHVRALPARVILLPELRNPPLVSNRLAAFQPRRHMRRVTSLWWQLTQNVTLTSEMITLQKRCFEIDVSNIPLSIRCELTLESKARTSTRGGVGLEVPNLTILKATKNPSCLNLKEVSFLVTLNG